MTKELKVKFEAKDWEFVSDLDDFENYATYYKDGDSLDSTEWGRIEHGDTRIVFHTMPMEIEDIEKEIEDLEEEHNELWDLMNSTDDPDTAVWADEEIGLVISSQNELIEELKKKK